jgi:hypothetical protein
MRGDARCRYDRHVGEPARRRAPSLAGKLPRIIRPRDLPRASRPVDVPQPEHSHLPGWVRKVHAEAAPIFGDMLAQLEGEDKTKLEERINATVAQISAGKFSNAWHYPTLIEQGFAAWARERNQKFESERTRRDMDGKRKRLTAAVRDPLSKLSTETASKLARAVTSARDPEALEAAELEVNRAVDAAQSADTRRRDREISKTRDRISRSAPKSRSSKSSEPETESWQDVLRRLTESGTPS